MSVKNFSKVSILAIAFVFSGCAASNEPKESVKLETLSPVTSSVSQKAPDLSVAGSLKGRILFDGAAPPPKEISVKGNPECAGFHPNGNIQSEELLVQDGGIKDAFVYIKEGLEAYSFATPTEPVIITNTHCIYSPHVAGAQTNQSLVFLNNDSTLHNIHAHPQINTPFNLGLPFTGMKQTKKFSRAEVMVPMKCDVHPWMSGFIGVLPHPYFAVTDAKGDFELKNIPPGEYLVEVWQEKLGVQSQKIKIEPRASQTIEFKYKS